MKNGSQAPGFCQRVSCKRPAKSAGLSGTAAPRHWAFTAVAGANCLAPGQLWDIAVVVPSLRSLKHSVGTVLGLRCRYQVITCYYMLLHVITVLASTFVAQQLKNVGLQKGLPLFPGRELPQHFD